MPKHMKCFFVCSLTLLLVSMAARAELYLVVGSYSKAASATSEAARLSGVLGVDVTTLATVVDGVTYQRAMLRAGSTNSKVDQLLAQQGISPWRFNLNADANVATATASVESDTKQYFVVAASYTDVEKALEEERTLADYFNSVRGQTSLLEGEVQHRVLVGPDARATAEQNRIELVSLGYTTAWLLPAAVDEYGYLYSSTSLTVSDQTTQESPRMVRPKAPAIEEDKSGYNLATLPDKNPVFK